jgi:serine/threonine protein kinase
MSEIFFDKSTVISQFKEYYSKKLLELIKNPKYQHLDISNYVDKYMRECNFSLKTPKLISKGVLGNIYEYPSDTSSFILKRMHVLYPYDKRCQKSDLIMIDKRVKSGIFYNEYLDRFLNEALINIILQNENSELFCPLLGFNFTEDTEDDYIIGYFNIIMENCGHDINLSGSTFSDLLRWFIEIAEAIQIMHSLNIAHNDFHSGNILLMNSHIKFIDFGRSLITEDLNEFTMDIYWFGRMITTTITEITGTDDLGPFMPIEPILLRIHNNATIPIEVLLEELKKIEL